MGLIQTFTSVVFDRSIDELFGALFIALGLSVVVAWATTLLRKREDAGFSGVAALMGLACLASMIVAAARLETSRPGRFVPHQVSYPAPRPPQRPWHGPDPSTLIFFRAADSDGDGRLTHEEAASAADRFVRDADRSGLGSITAEEFSAAFRPPPPPSGGPMPVPTHAN